MGMTCQQRVSGQIALVNLSKVGESVARNRHSQPLTIALVFDVFHESVSVDRFSQRLEHPTQKQIVLFLFHWLLLLSIGCSSVLASLQRCSC